MWTVAAVVGAFCSVPPPIGRRPGKARSLVARFRRMWGSGEGESDMDIG